MADEAHFKDISNIIFRKLEDAKHTIFLAVAWLTDKRIKEQLAAKAEEGLLVEVLLDENKANRAMILAYYSMVKNGGRLYTIEKKGTEVLMHNKFCIIDLKITITGSYNWTNKAKDNHENIIISHDEKFADKFLIQFFKLRKSSFDILKITRSKDDSEISSETNREELKAPVQQLQATSIKLHNKTTKVAVVEFSNGLKALASISKHFTDDDPNFLTDSNNLKAGWKVDPKTHWLISPDAKSKVKQLWKTERFIATDEHVKENPGLTAGTEYVLWVAQMDGETKSGKPVEKGDWFIVEED